MQLDWVTVHDCLMSVCILSTSVKPERTFSAAPGVGPIANLKGHCFLAEFV